VIDEVAAINEFVFRFVEVAFVRVALDEFKLVKFPVVPVI
jgi:hypothetical protein